MTVGEWRAGDERDVAMNRDHSERDPGAEALEAFFRAGRASEAPPSAAFLSAVLADAADVSAAARRVSAEPRAPAPRAGLRRGLANVLGGWRGGVALAACALAGFLIGVSGQARISTDTATYSLAGESASDIGEFYDLAALDRP
jgi:hypothetical protein